MKKLIFFMAMLCMLSTDVALAQTKKRARKPTASVTKTTPPKRQDDAEYKRLVHERDSLEALRDDLLGRKNLQPLTKTTFKDGTRFEVFIVRGNDNGRGQMHLRVMNPNMDVEKFYSITRYYDNGDKEPSSSEVAAKFVSKKGIWCNRVWGFNCVNHDSIIKLEIKDVEDKETKILTDVIKIEYDE